jgi:hypothetical protein
MIIAGAQAVEAARTAKDAILTSGNLAAAQAERDVRRRPLNLLSATGV